MKQNGSEECVRGGRVLYRDSQGIGKKLHGFGELSRGEGGKQVLKRKALSELCGPCGSP